MSGDAGKSNGLKAIPHDPRFTPIRVALSAFVGFIVGVAGGLVGLGGAELRLPYLAGTLGLPLKTAIPVNLAVSLLTLLAALPTRLYTLSTASLTPFLYETIALGLGAILGAYAGVSGLRRLSSVALRRAVFSLLLALGVVMIAESVVSFVPLGVLPEAMLPRITAGLILGLAIGAISGLLGVAGGEVIIPTFILGFGAPIKAAGSLSQMVSIPTVLTSFVRHCRAGALNDRAIVMRLILPMGLGAIAGGIGGGLLSYLAPSSFLKALLGVILIVSSVKVFARQGVGPRDVVMRLLLLTTIAAPLLFAASAQAEEKEPSAIVEIGGAGEWSLPGVSSFGSSAAVEFTPIKNWLEIEAGVSTLFGGGQTEWSTDLLFKKPFTLSDKVEFMVGVGPEWTFSRDGTKIAGEVALDFMFWPTPDRRYGWFLEPSYSYSFSQGHEQSLGVSVGLLIPIP